MTKHNARCAYFNEPPTLRDPSDCNCGAIPSLPSEVTITRRAAVALRDYVMGDSTNDIQHAMDQLDAQLGER